MLFKTGWQQTLTKLELNKLLKENGIEEYQQVTRIILGDDDSYYDGRRYRIVDTYSSMHENPTLAQRLNRLWFVPVYLLTVPLQWLIRGQVGMDDNSKMGKFFLKITGLK